MKVSGIQKLLLAVGAVSMLTSPAWAGFAQGNQVTMGGEPVFAIQGSADGYSPDHRAWLTQDALDNALVLAYDRSPSAVRVERMNGALVVTLDGRKVATADSNSASLEGLSARALADKWANGIKNFLSDSSRTGNYVAELTGKNAIQGQVAVLERRIYAPPGTVLPVVFSTAISSETIKAGDRIEGTLSQEVAFGNYVLPAGAGLIGVVNESQPGVYTIAFNTLRLASGTELPISATLTSEFLANTPLGPHPVCTLTMPPGYGTDCRVPATIGIGTLGGGRAQSLVLRRGTNLVIATGQPVSLMFDTVTPIAVVMRSPAM